MQVLLVTPRFRAGARDGGDIGATLLAQALEAHGVHVRVACEETEDPNVQAAPLTARRIARLAAGADVVHAFHLGQPSAVLRGARRAGVPAVTTATAYEATCLWGDHTFPSGEPCHRCTLAGLRRDYRSRDEGTLTRRVLAPLARVAVARRTLMLGSFERVITPSEAARRRLAEAGAPSKRLTVVPPMADPAWMAEALPEERPVGPVAYVGRLSHEKGPALLLHAIARLPGTHATFVGDGPERARLEATARDRAVEDRVTFAGHVARPDVRQILAGASALAVPSLWEEPTARVILEAWSLGTPVVASHRGAPGELVTHETNGLIVPADDPRALADALRRVQETPGLTERLREGGRKQAEAHHPDRIAPRMLDVYEAVRAGRAPESR